MKVLIATTNPGKISIYSTIFDKLGIEWCSLKDFDNLGEVEETGETPRENSIIKAVATKSHIFLSLQTIADLL